MDNTPVKTPSRKTYFLSPSCKDISILCLQETEVTANRTNLWNDDRSKTSFCEELEECVGEEISFSKDFKILCRNCLRKVRTALKGRVERKELLKKNREFASSIYLRSHTKRMSKFEEPITKKRLHFEETIDSKFSSVFSDMQIGEGTKSRMKVCMVFRL